MPNGSFRFPRKCKRRCGRFARNGRALTLYCEPCYVIVRRKAKRDWWRKHRAKEGTV